MSQPNNVSAAGDDDLAQMTPNQKRALSKALSALETMAALWAGEIRLTDMAKRIADVPDAAERAKCIAAFIEQGFIEGAYRHYRDHKDRIEALAAASDQAKVQAVPIYQLQQVNGAWQDVSKDKFDAIACNYGRVVYAAPSPAAREAGDGVSEVERDAARYQWLRERFTGYDFDWMPSEPDADDGKSVVVFNVGREFRGGRDITEAIDAALLREAGSR